MNGRANGHVDGVLAKLIRIDSCLWETFSFLVPPPRPPCFTCVMNLPQHWSKTKIGGVNLLKKPVLRPHSPKHHHYHRRLHVTSLSWQRAGRHLQRCYMSLKLVNCLLAPGAFHSAVPPCPLTLPAATTPWFAGISRKFFPQIFNPRRDWQCCQTSGRVFTPLLQAPLRPWHFGLFKIML